jgi:hypothetical protein
MFWVVLFKEKKKKAHVFEFIKRQSGWMDGPTKLETSDARETASIKTVILKLRFLYSGKETLISSHFFHY